MFLPESFPVSIAKVRSEMESWLRVMRPPLSQRQLLESQIETLRHVESNLREMVKPAPNTRAG